MSISAQGIKVSKTLDLQGLNFEDTNIDYNKSCQETRNQTTRSCTHYTIKKPAYSEAKQQRNQ